MSWKASTLSFILAFTTGVWLVPSLSLVERLWPSFSEREASAKVGLTVRHCRTPEFGVMKCSNTGHCLRVNDGESGLVIGIEKVPDGGYFLKVRWDQHRDHYLSYFGRYSSRALTTQ